MGGRLIRVLVPHRCSDTRLRDRVLQAIDQFERIRKRRNDLIHSIWRVPNDARNIERIEAAKLPARRSPDYMPVTTPGSANELVRAADDAYGMLPMLEQVHFDLFKQLRNIGGSSPEPPNSESVGNTV